MVVSVGMERDKFSEGDYENFIGSSRELDQERKNDVIDTLVNCVHNVSKKEIRVYKLGYSA